MKLNQRNRVVVTAAFSGALILGAAGLAAAATGADPIQRVRAEQLNQVDDATTTTAMVATMVAATTESIC